MITARLQRIGQRVEAVQPEVGWARDVVLLLRKTQRQRGSRELLVVLDRHGEPQKQGGLPRPTRSDQQMMLMPSTTQIFHEVIEQTSPRHERGNELLARE